MAANLNIYPYFDDYDKSKNYLKILFRPTIPVQARELTQLQTAVQNQINMFGSSIYKEGTVVLGGQTFIDQVDYLLLVDSSGNDLSETVASSFVNKTLTSTTGFSCTVLAAVGNKIYFKHSSGISASPNELLVSTSDTTHTCYVKNDPLTFTGFSSRFSITESVFFVNGYFVICNPQSIFFSENNNKLSYCIGLSVGEHIIDIDMDSTLGDPAQGYYNWQAPGADRYAMSMDLTAYLYDPANRESVAATNIKDFIELARIENGVVVSKISTQYSNIGDELAIRTYEESGNYTVTPFVASVVPNIFGDTDKLSVKIEAGKSYVRGYRFETTAPSYFDLPKSRTTNTISNYPIVADLNNIYLYVSNVQNKLNLSEYYEATIVNSSSTKIGTCYIRGIDYVSNRGSIEVYRLYVDNITFDSGKTLADATGVKVDTSFSATIDLSSYDGTVTLGTATANIVKIPRKWVKTTEDSTGKSTLLIQNKVSVSGIMSYVSGSSPAISKATISLPSSSDLLEGSGILSEYATNSRFIVSVSSIISGTDVSVSQVLTYGDGLRINVLSGGNSFEVTYPASFNGNIQVTCNVVSNINVLKKKNIQTITDTINAPFGDTITLTQADGISLTSVIATTPTGSSDITSAFTFDGGQNDYFYGLSKLIKNGTIDSTITSLEVTYSYYSHTGSGVFTVDSYTNSSIDYEKIPTYVASSGETYELRDCLDFRVRQSSDGSFVNDTRQVINGSTMTLDFEYYQGRKDKLVVTKDKKFDIIHGTPSDNPSVPGDLPDAMTIYTLTIAPYTLSTKDVVVSYVDNRRFTMRDIGKMNKKIDQLTYYTSLSLLEKQAQDAKFASSIPGVDKFKNGILVDSFAGHSVGDVSNPDYRCSIDYNERYARPMFKSSSYTFKPSTSSNISYANKLITLAYKETNLYNQPYGTRTVNLNPYSVFSWTGTLSMNPPSDTWVDTNVKPAVTVNLNGENDVFSTFTDNISNPASVGVKWSDWKTTVKGIDLSITATNGDTQTTTELHTGDSSARSGLEVSKSAITTINTDLGSRVTDLSVVPYIRSRYVDFIARGVKPFTEFYAIFDGVNVTDYCSCAVELLLDTVPKDADEVKTPSGDKSARVCGTRTGRAYVIYSGSTFAVGDSLVWYKDGNVISGTTSVISGINTNATLISSEVGIIAGTFLIPNNSNLRFKIGERTFRLQDSLLDDSDSVAEFKYVATGFSQTTEQTYLATRVQQVSINPKYETSVGGVAVTTSSVTVPKETTTTTTPVTTTQTTVTNVSASSTTSTNVTNSNISTVTTYKDTLDVVATTPDTTPKPNYLVCGTKQTFLDEPYLEYTIDFKDAIGTCGIKYKHFKEPVWFEILWNGNTYRSYSLAGTAPTGASDWTTLAKKMVDDKGYSKLPASTKLSGYTNYDVAFTFNKTLAAPNTATLRIYNPFSNKQVKGGKVVDVDTKRTDPSSITVICPNLQDGMETSKATAHFTPIFTFAGVGTGSQVSWTDKYANDKGTGCHDVIGGYIWNLSDAQVYTINKNLKPFKGSGINSYLGFAIRNPSQVNTDDIKINSISVVTGSDVIKINGWSQVAITPVSYSYSDSTWAELDNASVVSKKSADVITKSTGLLTNRCMFKIYLSPQCLLNASMAAKYAASEAAKLNKTIANGTNTGLKVDMTVAGVAYSFHVPYKLEIDYTTPDTSNPDPVAQTFKISKSVFPNGVFLSSIGLFFKKRSTTSDVTLQIRPVVNGFPSSDTVLPFSIVNVHGSDIQTSTDGSVETKFNFDSPVYLLPDKEYAFVAIANDTSFEIFTAAIGDFLTADKDVRVTQQPFVGSMFKSQNSSTWTPIQEEDVKFNINICEFDTTTSGNITLEVDCEDSIDEDYHLYYMGGEMLDFADTNIGFSLNTTQKDTGEIFSSQPYQVESNMPMVSTMTLSSPSSLSVSTTLKTNDKYTSPVIDLTRLSCVLVKNIINNDSTNETDPFGGNAAAKYIHRKVTLLNGMDALDTKVFVNAKLPIGTSIEAYYKVSTSYATSFEEQHWVKMEVEYGTPTPDEYSEWKFVTPNGHALNTTDVNGDIERFKYFSTKIVMLSSAPVKVPQISDLRVIALDD